MNVTSPWSGTCFVDYDHSLLSPQELELFDTEVQIPGSQVKAKVRVCLHHKAEMEALRSNDLEAVRAMSVAPFGRCHVCKQAVGLRDESTPQPDRMGETVPVTYWEHIGNEIEVCHENCRCQATIERVHELDESGNLLSETDIPGQGGRVGKHRRIVLV